MRASLRLFHTLPTNEVWTLGCHVHDHPRHDRPFSGLARSSVYTLAPWYVGCGHGCPWLLGYDCVNV